MVYGSAFQDRIFVASAPTRKLLLQFCRAEGLAADTYALLQQQLAALREGTPARALLPFVEQAVHLSDGSVRCKQPWQALLRDLSTAAPASVILKPCVYGLVDRLLAAGDAAATLTLAEQQHFASHCPLLHCFVRPYLRCALADS